MSAALEAYDRSIGMPFISDPLETAAKLYSLSQAQRRLAHQYRHWADESTTELERRKWSRESARYWDNAFFHLRKCREYMESANG